MKTVQFRILCTVVLVTVFAVLAVPAAEAAVVQPICPIIINPAPTGSLGRPADTFTSDGDYYWVHSSTHLQGRASTEKFAPGLFFNPSTPVELSGFRSAVAVNNPSPTATATVTIQFLDQGGLPLGPPNVVVLGPDATWAKGAIELATYGNGRGSAQITSDEPIVGVTIHHTPYTIIFGSMISDPDYVEPYNGAVSLQQLQQAQDANTKLWWGPVPESNMMPIDSLNGVLPFFWVMNPNPVSNTISISISSRGGAVLTSPPVILPPYGNHLEMGLWNALVLSYASGSTTIDDDWRITVTSTSGLPLIGEGVMTDFFGDGGANNLVVGTKFRMTSSMMANTKSQIPVNPELTYETVGPTVETMVGVWNASTSNIGPLRVRYYNRNGVLLGTDTVTTFGRGAVLRIGPGLVGSPNYPAPGVFDGWLRIEACGPGLVGWTMREVEGPGFNKTYGEVLQGMNGTEPGPGLSVTVGGTNMTRKVAPFVRTDGSFWWPGYMNFVNNSVGNVGAYYYRFFDLGGADITRYAGQPFVGVPWGNTSFTYEDAWVTTFFALNGSARVDHTRGRIEGIEVLGDPMIEYGIPDFLDF